MGLLAPAALLFAGLLAPVIAMYFIRQRRESVVLPTIALWARFVRQESQAARFQRFRNNLLLWLQLALMAALILSLARPFRHGGRAPGQVTVIVLDASASMQTREGGTTRFERAKAEIADTVAALGGGDRMMLVAAGPRPWVVQGLTDDARAFTRALRQVRCTDGSGNLATALRVAAQAAGPGAPPYVLVWTDGAGASLAGVERLRVPVEWHAVGEARDNVAVTALAVRRRPDSPLDLEVFAAVTNSGHTAREVAISLRLDETLLAFNRRTLDAGETVSLTEPLLAGRTGVIRLRVESDDALPLDNVATLVLAPRRTTDVLLVTAGNNFLERVLGLLPGVALSVARPGARVAGRPADLVVLDRWVPPRWPAAPTLLFGPAAGPAFPGAQFVHQPAVLSWRRDHPLLRFLTLSDVHVAAGLVQPSRGGVTPLVSTTQGGLIWTRGAGSSRRIVVGFALDASDWILRPSFPLFLANVIESVRDESGDAPGAATRVGESLHVRTPSPGGAVTVEYPDGVTAEVTPRGQIITVDDTWQAGLYRFEGGNWSATGAVNLLDAAEARVEPRPLPTVSSTEAQRAGFGITREYWPWLLFLALVLSVLEWGVFHRRTT